MTPKDHYISLQEFMFNLLALEPCRPGDDFYQNESLSLVCLETLFNQRVGIERASAAALAVHDYFYRPFKEEYFTIDEYTAWPYDGLKLTPAAKSLFKMVNQHMASLNPHRPIIANSPSSIIGALASLERYYHRGKERFGKLRSIELEKEQIESLVPDDIFRISRLHLPEKNLKSQLRSAQALYSMQSATSSTEQIRKELIKLERIGEETADTLLVYFFKKPAIIVDEFLRRILHRHEFLDNQRLSRKAMVELLSPFIMSYDHAHRLHARINEIAGLWCHAKEPECATCPLGDEMGVSSRPQLNCS